MSFCSRHDKSRKHSHETTDDLRSRYWKKCRKNGCCRPYHCVFCGDYGCIQHNDHRELTLYRRRELYSRAFTSHRIWTSKIWDVGDRPLKERDYDGYSDEDDYGECSNNDNHDDFDDLDDFDGSTEAHEDYDRQPSVSSRHTCHQCDKCKIWFDFERNLALRYDGNDSGCSKYRECFQGTDIYEHAKTNRHDRCFIQGCEDKYARLGGWTDREIEEHVCESHCTRKKASVAARSRSKFDVRGATISESLGGRARQSVYS